MSVYEHEPIIEHQQRRRPLGQRNALLFKYQLRA